MNATIFATCRSPRELADAAGVELPSEAIATILDAIYATPEPTPEQRKLWKQISPKASWFSSNAWPTKPARRAALCIGRRGLKTSGVLAWACAYEVLCVPHEQHTLAGSRLYYCVIAPMLQQAREAVRAIRVVLDQLAGLGVRYSMRDASGSPEIVIEDPASGVEKVIAVFSASAVAVRGHAIPWAAIDEAGFLPSEEWNAVTDETILRALGPALTQFDRSKLLLVSSPGAPRGIFYKWVTSPPRGTLVVRCSTWVTNPRQTREKCRATPGIDDAAFAQEFAVERFGYADETFIDAAAVLACVDREGTVTPKGSRNLGAAGVVAVDAASTGDDAAFGVGFSISRSLPGGTGSIRDFVIEAVETWASSRDKPNTIDAIADHAAALSNAYGGLPVVADNRSFADLAHRLATRHGFKVIRESDDAERLRAIAKGGRIVVERPMTPAVQTMRWRSLRDAVLGQRLHLPNTPEGEKAARQIGQLRAETLSSGWLRVEGKKDDAADVVALLVEACEARPPLADDGSESRWVHDGNVFEHGVGVVQLNGRWVRPDGMPGTIPRSHPDFWLKCREAVAAGHRAEPWWSAVAELSKKTIPEESDFRTFLDSDLGRATYHGDRVRPEELITSFDQIDPMFWLKKKLPRM